MLQKISLIVLLLAAFSIGTFELVLAESIPVSNGGILPGPSGDADTKGIQDYLTGKFLPAITNWFLVILTMLAVVIVIIGGMMFIASGGDEEMYKKGRDTVLWAIIGVVVAILSYAIVKFIIEIDFL